MKKIAVFLKVLDYKSKILNFKGKLLIFKSLKGVEIHEKSKYIRLSLDLNTLLISGLVIYNNNHV